MAKRPSEETDRASALERQLETILEGESDRGAAIVGAAMLEEALRALVTVTFDEEHAGGVRALGRFGAIGSLNGSIEYAFGMGLISDHEKDEAVRVKEIRNSAAHSLVDAGMWSFDSTPWTTPGNDLHRPREVFAIVVAGLVGAISRRVDEARAIKASGEDGRGRAIAWLLESVDRPLLNRTYLAMFDADPPSEDPFD